MSSRLGIMGGTFDPPHAGHVAIAESYLNSGLIDRLLVIPVYSHPQKDLVLTPYSIRMTMARAAFDQLEGVQVSDIESRLPVPSYTWNTVGYLTKAYPAASLHLCIGGDSLVEFTTWYRYRDILGICDLIVAERPGFERPDLPSGFAGKVRYISHQPVNVAATEIRKKAARGDLSGIDVPPAVFDIIRMEGLYRQQG